jgi:hypothetical protein
MAPDLVKIVGRPITPARGFYTSILSRYVSDFLVRALPLVNSYVRDASDAIQKLYNLRLQRGVTYFSGTGDIPSMFTNIPMNLESKVFLLWMRSPMRLLNRANRSEVLELLGIPLQDNV